MGAQAKRQGPEAPETPSQAAAPRTQTSPSAEAESQHHAASTATTTSLERQTKDPVPEPATTTTTGNALHTDTAHYAVNFIVNDEKNLQSGSDYLYRAVAESSYTVDVILHQALHEKSDFEIQMKICGFGFIDNNNRDVACQPAQLGNSRGNVLSRRDDTTDNVTFALFEGRQAYFLRAEWSRPDVDIGTIGWTYSRVFGLFDGQGDESMDQVASADEVFKKSWGEFTFQDGDAGNQDVSISTERSSQNAPDSLLQVLNGPSTGVLPSRPAFSTGTAATISPASEPTETPPSESGGNGGGLSTGAIAGIGVAAGIVGLAAIGLLVWFFCLRNRRKPKSHGPYAAPDAQASEYMVNKETTGAHVTESPHSPYSDDGSPANPHNQAHASPTQQQHHHLRQYSDAPPIAAPVPRSASQQAADRPPSRSGARSGTPAGGNVSHLIEEGMTEADIRRLEEEERALDDAIERAGHGRRG